MSVPIFNNSVFVVISEDCGDVMVFNNFEAAKTYCDVYGCKEPVRCLSAIIIDSVAEWGFTDYSITPCGEIALETKGITVVLRETGNYSYELTVG